MAFTYTVKKGDTLNAIAQRYGFGNYRQAGISSVPSGNFDLIREGEQVTLNNYDPNKVTTIQQGSPVVSSKDNEQQFREDSDRLKGIEDAFASGTYDSGSKTDETDTKTTDRTPFATGEEKTVDGATTVETTGDPILDKLNAWEQKQDEQLKKEAEVRKKEYESLFTTSLAAVDATAQATIDRINTSYDKRVAEQERINAINVARVKAYGLARGGQYTPISFSDAVTQREEEAADKISSLEGQRNSLIAEARAARDAGESKLLREKLADLDGVEEQLRKQLADVEAEAESQYKLLRDLRKEEEEKHKQEVEDMKTRLASIAPQYADEYDSMTDEERDALITQLATQTGLDYATVYATLQNAITKAKGDALDIKKKEADIEASKALKGQRDASAASSWANAAVKKRETKDKAAMQAEIPDTFASADEAEEKRREFVKKYGEQGKSYWDAIFYNDTDEDYNYPLEGGGSGENGDDPLGIL